MNQTDFNQTIRCRVSFDSFASIESSRPHPGGCFLCAEGDQAAPCEHGRVSCAGTDSRTKANRNTKRAWVITSPSKGRGLTARQRYQGLESQRPNEVSSPAEVFPGNGRVVDPAMRPTSGPHVMALRCFKKLSASKPLRAFCIADSAA